MRFSSFYAESESNGHFLGALAFSQQLNDFALARGKPVPPWRNYGARCAAFEIAFQHHGRDFGSEIRLVMAEGFDGGYQISGCVGFQQESARAGIQDFAHYLV